MSTQASKSPVDILTLQDNLYVDRCHLEVIQMALSSQRRNGNLDEDQSNGLCYILETVRENLEEMSEALEPYRELMSKGETSSLSLSVLSVSSEQFRNSLIRDGKIPEFDMMLIIERNGVCARSFALYQWPFISPVFADYDWLARRP